MTFITRLTNKQTWFKLHTSHKRTSAILFLKDFILDKLFQTSLNSKLYLQVSLETQELLGWEDFFFPEAQKVAAFKQMLCYLLDKIILSSRAQYLFSYSNVPSRSTVNLFNWHRVTLLAESSNKKKGSFWGKKYQPQKETN